MEKLRKIQQELKAPKGQYNSFGKYKYRSCEDIIEAVKPICHKYQTLITLSDEMVLLGDRYYIKATATLYDTETKETIAQTVAYAREEAEKKGMDGSQITGAASSYARKYALNGLLQIDDTNDADTNEYQDDQEPLQNGRELLIEYLKKENLNMNEIAKEYKLNGKSTDEDFLNVLSVLKVKEGK